MMEFYSFWSSRNVKISIVILVVTLLTPVVGMRTFPTTKCYNSRFLFQFSHVQGFPNLTEKYKINIASVFNRTAAAETKCRGVIPRSQSFNYFRNSSDRILVTVKFTAMNLSSANSTVINCISAVIDHLKNGTQLAMMGENDTSYKANYVKSIWKRSCCGGNASIPCCHQPSSVKLNDSNCACSRGYYLHNITFNKPCRPCWVNWYQNTSGAARCTRCPEGKVTCGLRGSTNISSCLAKKDCPRPFCPPTNESNSLGQISWRNTTAGHMAFAQCPSSKTNANATRQCNRTGHWEKTNIDPCSKADSQISQALSRMTQENVTKDNAKEISTELKNLTNNVEDLSSTNIRDMARVLSSLVNTTDALHETKEDIAQVFSKMLEVNASQLDGQVSKSMVNSIETLSQNLPVPKNQTSITLRTTNLMIVTTRMSVSLFEGLSVDFKDLTAGVSQESSESISLPQSLFDDINVHGKEEAKLGSVLFLNSKLFSAKNVDDATVTSSYLNSRVISAGMKGIEVKHLNTQPVGIRYKPLKVDSKSVPMCVFWNFKLKGGLGAWSREGCNIAETGGDYVTCQCNHMTNFAMLFSPRTDDTTENEDHARILTIISYLGCAVSLACLTLTLVTYALFRTLHKSSQQPILVCLSVSLIFLLTVFIAGVERTENRIVCQIVAALLHYSVLSAVLWMGIEGYQMYLAFIKILSTYHEKFILKCALVAWGLPALVVGATLASARSYYGNDQYCILTGVPFYAAMFVPVCLIITVNFVIFFFVIWSLGHRKATSHSYEQSRRYYSCLTAIAMMVLLGLTWIFGAMAFGKSRLVFEYLFCIFNSLQGMSIFIFHCMRIKEVRQHWSALFSKRSLRYATSVTSQRPSTYSKTSNRSIEKKGSSKEFSKTSKNKKSGELKKYSNPAYEKDMTT